MDFNEFVSNVFRASRLRSVSTIGTTEVAGVDSTAISEIAYNQGASTMTITFQSGGIYMFAGVDEAAYENLVEASSVGRTFVREVRNDYFYVRLN